MSSPTDCYTAIGRGHPDLVAVYASPRGHLGLLLRQTVVPLRDERSHWLAETRQTAAAVIASLRTAGFRERCLVLQWQPLPVVAHVLQRWHCRYAGDPVRLGEVRRVVERFLADRAFVASRAGGPPRPMRET